MANFRISHITEFLMGNIHVRFGVLLFRLDGEISVGTNFAMDFAGSLVRMKMVFTKMLLSCDDLIPFKND